MITDYASLVSEVQDYLKTPSINTKTDLFIQQTEADLNRELRHPLMEAEVPITLSGNTISLPTGFLELRDINVAYPHGTFSLEQVSPETLNRVSFTEPSRRPNFYALENGVYVVHPSLADSELKLLYYEAIPALTATNTTNWVLNNYPMLYWYGVIEKAWQWKMDDSQINRYGNYFANEMRSVSREGKRRRYGGQGVAIRGV